MGLNRLLYDPNCRLQMVNHTKMFHQPSPIRGGGIFSKNYLVIPPTLHLPPAVDVEYGS